MINLLPFLWYTDKAEEAAAFYCSIIPNSKILSSHNMPADSPSGPPGAVKIVQFELAGRPFMAMAAGKHDPFNDAISLMLEVDTQDELDRLWNALLDGGKPSACGWLKDRYGVSWQITPRRLNAMMAAPDRAAAKRAAEAMMKMVKLDIAELERAFKG
jgi:predicted 3-demethylubiquinone-9 3-methyltransferase (glyoxalase superfamily)